MLRIELAIEHRYCTFCFDFKCSFCTARTMPWFETDQRIYRVKHVVQVLHAEEIYVLLGANPNYKTVKFPSSLLSSRLQGTDSIIQEVEDDHLGRTTLGRRSPDT